MKEGSRQNVVLSLSFRKFGQSFKHLSEKLYRPKPFLEVWRQLNDQMKQKLPEHFK